MGLNVYNHVIGKHQMFNQERHINLKDQELIDLRFKLIAELLPHMDKTKNRFSNIVNEAKFIEDYITGKLFNFNEEE